MAHMRETRVGGKTMKSTTHSKKPLLLGQARVSVSEVVVSLAYLSLEVLVKLEAGQSDAVLPLAGTSA